MTSADDILAAIRRSLDQLREYRRADEVQRIHVTAMATQTIEDWTDVRSPGRARRRRAKHPQRIRVQRGLPAILRVGPVMYVHPEKWAALVRKADMRTIPGEGRVELYGVPVTFDARPDNDWKLTGGPIDWSPPNARF